MLLILIQAVHADECDDRGFSAEKYVTVADWAAKNNILITLLYYPGDELAVNSYIQGNNATKVANSIKITCETRDEYSKHSTCFKLSNNRIGVFYHFQAPPMTYCNQINEDPRSTNKSKWYKPSTWEFLKSSDVKSK